MESDNTKMNVLLDELLSVFYHKFIYYVPSEIIIEGVIDQLNGEIEDDFFDEFYFIDNYEGSSKFCNMDALEMNLLLADKRSFLQQNTFKLVEKSKEITEFQFLIIIEKYYEFLLLFNYITEWLSVNLKKYNGEDIHLSIIGAYGIQMQYFRTHLEDVCNYFGGLIDLDKEYDFSMKPFVMRYLSELISRYEKIARNTEEKAEKLENCNQEITQKQVDVTKVKNKKHRPELDDNKIEAMILTQVFNVNQKVL